MSAARVDVIRFGQERARTGPWRGDEHVAFIAPLPESPSPSAAFVQRCLGVLAERGFTRVVTGALLPAEQHGFLRAGFEVEERLAVLAHDLRDLPEMPPVATRAARSSDRARVLMVDNVAFPPFWRLDGDGLDEAVTATPRARFRVVDGDEREPIAYAITGRAARRGYVQRLAVHPDARHHRLGQALVIDGLRWLRRWRATQAVVNTQLDNTPALGLYQRLGFRRQALGLSVLAAGLGG
ncbi:MAG: GNAT family N-acetyltransferase [Actinobacteria bacterium]|nr:GNAT family N-acetyltransferase [Actinomycetota bacterium]